MQLPHAHLGKNSSASIVQGKPIECPHIQGTPDTNTDNRHGNTRTRTRMAHTYVQSLEKQPHPAPNNNKASNTY